MDRSRRMPQRRRHLGASASPTSASEASFESNPLTSPVVAHTNTTPQSVGGRRSTKPLQHTFSFSPPGSSRNSNPKRRSTTMDSYPIPDGGEHGPRKGGHSLRKRARVDYTFEHIDDDVVVPNSTSSARGKKRRSEVNFDTDDFYSNDPKRRGASMGADTPSNRRKNPARKSSDLKAFHHAALQDDDNDVQDTIEVGAYYSDVDDSELREAVESNNSSPHSKISPKGSPNKSPKKESARNDFVAPQIAETHQLEPSAKANTVASEIEQASSGQVPSEQVSSAVEPKTTFVEETISQPTEAQTEEPLKVELQQEPVSAQQEVPAAADMYDMPKVEEPMAVPVTNSEPAVIAVPNTQTEEVEPEALPKSVPEPAPMSLLVTLSVPATTIALSASADNANNKSDSVHSPIVPAAETEHVNGVAGAPADEPSPQEHSENPEPEYLATDNINIKEEAPHQTSLDQVPESPDQVPKQHQENDMNSMDIDPVYEEPLAQDVEMADTVPLESQEPTPETQEPVPTAAASSSPSPPLPIAPSPLPSVSAPPPKSPSIHPAESVPQPTSPSPARELEQSQPTLRSTSPRVDASNEAPTTTELNGDSTEAEQMNTEYNENNKNKDSTEEAATANGLPVPDSPQALIAQEEPVSVSSPTELRAPTPPPAETIETPASSAPSETKTSPQKPIATRTAMESMPQPTPVGRWSHLKPYIDGEFVLYPEKKGQSNEDGTADDANPEGKDTDMEPMVDDQDDIGDGAGLEAPTPALNTPTRGSPVADSTDPTAFNSPAPLVDDGDDADVSESQELPGRNRYYKYRKLRDPEEYINAIENYEDMPTEKLFEMLEAINVSMVQWQDEWTELGALVDDHENSLRRRAADSKYESRTRNLHQHGVNYEEPEFAVKGYKSRDKEGLNETRYLQGQDRIMAASYGFEYDPHPSKIGKQNPETQQVGIMTRGRSLRNQPKQTAKATETDEVVGKRQRKPVQLFDPATQDVSRSSTPVPTTRGGGRRRRNANGDDDAQAALSVSFNNEVVSDNETPGPKTRRKRGTRGKNAPSIEDPVSTLEAEEAAQEELSKTTRRGRARPAVKYEEADPNEFVDDEPQEEEEEEEGEIEKEMDEKPPVRRHLLTLKLPRAYLSEVTPEMEITDNGDSRPTTASSEGSAHTVESAYSFRPKRQKRFRDDPDETEESSQAPPKKRGKRISGGTTISEIPSAASTPAPFSEPAQSQNNRKIQKIKVVRSGQDIKNGGTPLPPPPPPPPPAASIEEGDDSPKDYKSMTKSEKMSASMKNRWANGNMAGAVEKRKATLAAKKAAQAAAEQRTGVVAPKPKGNKATAKRDSTLKMQMQQPDQPQVPQQQQQQPPPMLHQPPPMHQHQHHHQQHQSQPQHQPPQHPDQYQHHQHQHPHHPLHLQQQQQPMHQPHPHHLPPPPPPHQPGNPPPPFMHGHGQHHGHGHSHSHGHGMPGMGYPY
ncbi:hypothetical protein FGRMN_19 [Fusarium graminum]|nr:hypothetical protein FGRMN_19 [Fusarium graminum]